MPLASAARPVGVGAITAEHDGADQPRAVAASGVVPPLATRGVLVIAGVVAAVHLVAAATQAQWFDEAYMLSIGRFHLDWGSADQPPVTPLLALLMDWIAPGSVLAQRLPAVLATTAAVVLAALLARELGGDRRAQLITAGAQATALSAAILGHWLTPYSLEPFEWLALVWLLVRWVRLRDDRLLLALGVVAGVAAETKFQVLLLCAVMLLGVLLFGPRELLTRPSLWAGAAIATVLAAPTLVWQAVHGWPQLRMGAVVAEESEVQHGGRPDVAFGLVEIAGIAGIGLVLYGVWRLWRAAELRPYRFLGVTATVLYVFFVATDGRSHYLSGLYGILAAAGALGLQRRREAGRRRWRWVAWPAFGLSAAAAAALLLVSCLPNPPSPASVAREGEATYQRTAAAYRMLTPSQRARTAIVAESYIVAAYLDSHSHQARIPAAYSTNRAYGYFPPPPEQLDSALYVGTTPGSTPDELRPYFADERKVADSVWLCTGRRETWASFWPKLRHLRATPFVPAGAPENLG